MNKQTIAKAVALENKAVELYEETKEDLNISDSVKWHIQEITKHAILLKKELLKNG